MGESYLPLIRSAESILSRQFDTSVRLRYVEDLSSSGRARLLRCKVVRPDRSGPKSVILKSAADGLDDPYDPDDARHGCSAWRLFNEWAGAQFLGSLAGDFRHRPRLLGGNRNLGIVALEDLGSGDSLQDLLLGDDPIKAEEALVAWLAALGRMHAVSAGRADKFASFRRALGPYHPENRTYFGSDTVEERFSTLCSAVEGLGLTIPASLAQEVAFVAEVTQEPGPFLAYTHGDACPLNACVVDGVLRLFDFEYGLFRHALLDSVCPRMGFPTAPMVTRLPGRVLARMEAAYRTQLLQGCPEAGDDPLYGVGLAGASGYWLLRTVGYGLTPALEAADEPLAGMLRQRVMLRLEGFMETAEELHPAMVDLAFTLSTRLREIWPPGHCTVSMFPAFRSGEFS